MVSIRYLFEVGDASCLKSTLLAVVMSVKDTSSGGAAIDNQEDTKTPRNRKRLLPCRTKTLLSQNPFALLNNDQMVCRDVCENLPQGRRPEHFDPIGLGRRAQPEMQTKIVLRVIARTAHD